MPLGGASFPSESAEQRPWKGTVSATLRTQAEHESIQRQDGPAPLRARDLSYYPDALLLPRACFGDAVHSILIEYVLQCPRDRLTAKSPCR